MALFFEGKSSYDLAFTLWDDRFARVTMQPMGAVILPQLLVYVGLAAGGGVALAIGLRPHRARRLFLGVAVALAGLLIIFTGLFGYIQSTFSGGRQGPTGWVILQWPWLALALFVVANGAGALGVWCLFAPTPGKRALASKQAPSKWLREKLLASWIPRILLACALAGSSIVLCGALIIFTSTVNAALIFGVGAVVLAIIVLWSQPRLFTTTPQSMAVSPDFTPMNRTWRYVRNGIHCIFLPLCLTVSVVLAFMTVPDEWVFQRLFVLLPWIAIGCALGAFAMVVYPEPAVYYPLTMHWFASQYQAFLTDYTLPFQLNFIAWAGVLVGFWAGVMLSSMFHLQRTQDFGKNAAFMGCLTLGASLAWALICFVDRFQRSGDMVQKGITDFLELVGGGLIAAAWLIAGLAVIFRDFDGRHRLLRQNSEVPPPSEPARSPAKDEAAPVAHAVPLASLGSSPRRRRIIGLALVTAFLIPFAMVEVGVVYANQVRPLLLRTDQYGVWTVNGVVKVERTFSIQMPASAPVDPYIAISAARGEWEGFHVLVSAQPGQLATVSGLSWSDFAPDSGSNLISAGNLEPFLVEYDVDEQPDRLVVFPGSVSRGAGEHVDLFWRLSVPRTAAAGMYSANLTLDINGAPRTIPLRLQVFNFTLPLDRHLRTAFGGGWRTEAWYSELETLRISQYDMGIPFTEGAQYWWNDTLRAFEFNWTYYDGNFSAQLARGMTGLRQGYFPRRPKNVINDAEWAITEAYFLGNVSAHLASKTWVDERGKTRTWAEIPYNYWTDEPPVEEYPHIKEVNDRYHTGGPQLKTLLTEEYRAEYPALHDCVDIWCPVIGNFEPSAVANRHAAGQEYWFYVCVGPTASYPNLMLWEPGHNPRLLPLLCARFNADGFLYWSMTTSNRTYRAGFDGNGDGQIAFNDTRSGRCLPSLRLLSFSAGVEDYEYIWLMRETIAAQNTIGTLPSDLVSRATALELRLEGLGGARPQFVNYDLNALLAFRADLADFLEDLWPYTQLLY